MLPPHHHHETPPGPQCPPDVGERGDGVGEEHRPESADGDVEALRWERVGRGVRALEGDVGKPRRVREPAGPLDHGRGDIHPQRGPGLRHARRVTRRLPGSTPDIEDVIVGPDAVAPSQGLVVPLQLGIVVDAVHATFRGRLPLSRAPLTKPASSSGGVRARLPAIWKRFSTLHTMPSVIALGGHMASITIRKLDEKTKARLRVRAAQHGRSMEEEARTLLRAALRDEVTPGSNLADAIRARFGASAGSCFELLLASLPVSG